MRLAFVSRLFAGLKNRTYLLYSKKAIPEHGQLLQLNYRMQMAFNESFRWRAICSHPDPPLGVLIVYALILIFRCETQNLRTWRECKILRSTRGAALRAPHSESIRLWLSRKATGFYFFSIIMKLQDCINEILLSEIAGSTPSWDFEYARFYLQLVKVFSLSVILHMAIIGMNDKNRW